MTKRKGQVSSRQEKVCSLIQASTMDVLRKGKMLDERLLNCPLTITRVTITADLKLANCYFLPFNTSLKPEEILGALLNSTRYIRMAVTEKINLKYSPELKFISDQEFHDINRVDMLLRKIKEESGES
jgi:ribosome-binding factor A